MLMHTCNPSTTERQASLSYIARLRLAETERDTVSKTKNGQRKWKAATPLSFCPDLGLVTLCPLDLRW